MACINLESFKELLFHGADNTILSIELLPNMLRYDNQLSEAARERQWRQRVPSLFLTEIIILALGQYSVFKEVSLCSLSRADWHMTFHSRKLERAVYAIKIAKGNCPNKSDLLKIMDELDENVEPTENGQESVLDSYLLTFISKGKIKIAKVSREAFSLEKLQSIGRLEASPGKLLFFQEESNSNPVDFSGRIFKH